MFITIITNAINTTVTTSIIGHLNVREEGGGLDVEPGRDTTAYKSPEAGWR